MNKYFIIYLEKRLHHWAEWHSKKDLHGLGYPSCSREHKFMTEGVLIKNHRSQAIPCNEEAEEIESYIKELSEKASVIASSLRYHYLKRGSLRSKAKDLHMSHTQFKYSVDLAHYWLAGRLYKK